MIFRVYCLLIVLAYGYVSFTGSKFFNLKSDPKFYGKNQKGYQYHK